MKVSTVVLKESDVSGKDMGILGLLACGQSPGGRVAAEMLKIVHLALGACVFIIIFHNKTLSTIFKIAIFFFFNHDTKEKVIKEKEGAKAFWGLEGGRGCLWL